MNLLKLPTQKHFAENSRFTRGDLHGNVLNLIHFLIYIGALSRPELKKYNEIVVNYYLYSLYQLNRARNHHTVTTDLYIRLVKTIEQLWKLEQIDNANYLKFTKIAEQYICRNDNDELDIQIEALITKTKPLTRLLELINQLEVIKTNNLIRLIGDIFCDRGASDLAMAAVLKKIQSAGINVQYIASNHDMGLIEILTSSNTLVRPCSSALECLIDSSRESAKDTLKKFFLEYYLPNLKLIDYELVQQTPPSENKIILFSHAPNSVSCILKLAEKLNIPGSTEVNSAEKLAALIDHINIIYREKLNQVITMQLKPNIRLTEEELKFVWTRYDGFEPTKVPEETHPKFVESHVHGHVGEGPHPNAPKPFINLDCYLGASPEANTNKLKIFIQSPPKPEPQPKQYKCCSIQ